ncbi:hypothetical protein CLOP_g6312 [Closterium sp. NIES-67]|nr:hypothetical protein CLOP_g6312 [Closterium sp. NIES-67]
MSQSALNLVPPLSVKSPLFSVNSSLFAVNSSPHPAKPSNASVLHPHFTESPRHRQNRIKLKRSESDREATRCAPSVEVLPARCFRVHCHATPRKSGHRRKSQSERASSLVSTPTDKPKGFGGASIRRSDKLDSVANESASDARDPGSNPAVLPSQNSSEQASRLEPATSQRISSLDPVSPQPFPNLRPAIAPEPQAGKASAVTAGSSNGAVRSSRERRKKCGGLSSGHGRRGNLESGAGTTRPRNLESLASKGQGLSADSITPAATSATPAPGDIGFRPLRTGLGSRKRMSRTVTNRVARAVHALVLAARTDSQSPLLLAVKANTSASRAPELTLICDSQSESRMGKESLRELRRLKKLPAAFLRSVAEELWLVREFELAADVLDLIPPATSLGAGKSGDSVSSAHDSSKKQAVSKPVPSAHDNATEQQRAGGHHMTGGALRLHARVAAGLVAANHVERGVQLIGRMPREDPPAGMAADSDEAGAGRTLQRPREGPPAVMAGVSTSLISRSIGMEAAPAFPSAPPEDFSISPFQSAEAANDCASMEGSRGTRQPGPSLTLPTLGRLPLALSPTADLLASQISWQLMVPAQPAERQQPLVGRASSSTPSHPFSTPSPALSYAPGCALIEAFGEVGVVDGSVAVLLCMGWGWEESQPNRSSIMGGDLSRHTRLTCGSIQKTATLGSSSSGPESGEARAAGDIEGQDSRQRDENSQRSSGRELRSSALENGISPHFSSPQPCSRSLKREVHAVLMLAAALARCNRPDDALALLRFVLQSGSATWQAVRGQVAVVAREAEEAVLRALARAKRWGEIEEVVGEMSCLKQQAAGGAEGAEAVATREAEEAVARVLARERRWGEMEEVVGEMSCFKAQQPVAEAAAEAAPEATAEAAAAAEAESEAASTPPQAAAAAAAGGGGGGGAGGVNEWRRRELLLRSAWERGQCQQVASMLHNMTDDVAVTADVACSNSSKVLPALPSPPATTMNLAVRLLGASVVPQLLPPLVPQLLPAANASAESVVGHVAGFKISLSLVHHHQHAPSASDGESQVLARAFAALLRRYVAAVSRGNSARASSSSSGLQVDLHGLHSEAAAVVLLAWLGVTAKGIAEGENNQGSKQARHSIQLTDRYWGYASVIREAGSSSSLERKHREGEGTEELPGRVAIVTGWGKHSRKQGASAVRSRVEKLLIGMNSPFRFEKGNKGLLVARYSSLVKWMDEWFSSLGCNVM